MFLNRDAINAVNVQDAIDRITAYSCGCGFSLNIALDVLVMTAVFVESLENKIIWLLPIFQGERVSNLLRYSLHFRSVLTKELVNVEIAPHQTFSVLNVTGGYSYHFNEVWLCMVNRLFVKRMLIYSHIPADGT